MAVWVQNYTKCDMAMSKQDFLEEQTCKNKVYMVIIWLFMNVLTPNLDTKRNASNSLTLIGNGIICHTFSQ